MLGLDPDTEKTNLEKERGTVFDPNAPKTGPLPNNGASGVGEPNPGGPTRPGIPTSVPNKSTTPAPAQPPRPNIPSNTPPNVPSTPPPSNNKQTSVDSNNFFTKGGDLQKTQLSNSRKKITKIIAHSSKQTKDGEK
jgi:hypothetical protein